MRARDVGFFEGFADGGGLGAFAVANVAAGEVPLAVRHGCFFLDHEQAAVGVDQCHAGMEAEDTAAVDEHWVGHGRGEYSEGGWAGERRDLPFVARIIQYDAE